MASDNNNNDLVQKIIKQVEFYFGDVNISRDKFMQEEVKKDAGWIPVEILTKFNRLKMLSTDIDEITKALKESKTNTLEIDEENKKVRRSKPVPENVSELESQFKENTVYVKGFPENLTLDELYSFFETHGKILKIYMKRIPPMKKFSGKAFVTFESSENMQKFLELKDLKYQENSLSIETEKSYNDRHAGEREGKSKKKEEKKAKTIEIAKEIVEKEMKQGVVIHMKGFNEKCSREDIRELFDDYAKIEWINFNRGEPEAYLRLAVANSAKDALAKLMEAKNNDIELKGAKLECKVIEGDEEILYLKKEFEKSKTNNSNKRRGKQGFGKGKFNESKKNRNNNNNKRKNDDDEGENGDDHEGKNGNKNESAESVNENDECPNKKIKA